jgi:hypothetical protein
MRGKRCPYCRERFTPNPRVGKRQKTCGAHPCQRALNRDNSAQWRREHPDCCHPDYPRVKLWLQKHPGYLKRYRQSHPAYVEHNRQAQRLRDRREKLHLDIRNKIMRQQPEFVDGLWNSFDLDIQNEIGLQPIEMTLLFSNMPCLDIQNPLGKAKCFWKNSPPWTPGGEEQ